jgi:alkylated DNA repair protein (DNA oxidative demethylase)
MPTCFETLAAEAAAELGFEGFEPDACLINRYAVGARLTAHRDADETDVGAPIVSVSLGLPATFFFGGRSRNDATTKVRLEHGDVVVWGGASRWNYHGVLPIREGWHSDTGAHRYNLTFRRTR